jgi:hypothetical protein
MATNPPFINGLQVKRTALDVIKLIMANRFVKPERTGTAGPVHSPEPARHPMSSGVRGLKADREMSNAAVARSIRRHAGGRGLRAK